MIDNIKSELADYFSYIKTVYLGEYNKILTEEDKNRIKNITSDVIKLNDNNKFIVKTKFENIKFSMDLENYIKDNGLDDDNNFNDILKEGLEYRNYLNNFKTNPEKIIKELLLIQIIILFTKIKTNDVISVGGVILIADELVTKYKLPFSKILYQKEYEIAKKIAEITDYDNFKKSILLNKKEILQKNFDNYYTNPVENYLFEDISNELNKIYSYYSNSLNKVYLPDSLYQYEQINYKNIIKKLDDIKHEKTIFEEIISKRFYSIIDSINNLGKQKNDINYEYRQILYNSCLEVNQIVEKLRQLENKEEINRQISKNFDQILNIENKLVKVTEDLWKKDLTIPDLFDNNNQFNFLVDFTLTDDTDLITVNYLNEINFKKFENLSKNMVGYIYPMEYNSILATSTNNLKFNQIDDISHSQNYHTINLDDKIIEINNIEVSKLIIPNKNNQEINILLKIKNLKKNGIFCIFKEEIEELENDILYQRLEEQASKENIPLIIFYQKKNKLEEIL
ncbi:MAG: hypothetical protein ACK5HP_03045 [Bacilli bacterium]